MKAADHPEEARRLEVLRLYQVLDTAAEAMFDELTELAASICETPIALVSLVDGERQWFKSRVGLDATETSRDAAFCAHAILESGIFTIGDATDDPRFADNPLVTGDPRIRFYAGTPLVVEEGVPLGTLCVIDREPRRLSPFQDEALRRLGRVATALLQVRKRAAALKALEAMLPMCSSCRRVRDDEGGWHELEAFVHSREPVSHGICPTCLQAQYPELHDRLEAKHRGGSGG